MRRLRAALLVVALSAVGGGARADGLYLFVVPTTTSGDAPDMKRPVRVRLHTPGSEPDGRVVTTAEYPQLPPGSPEGFRGASFVVDYDQREIAALREAYLAGHTADAPVRVLADFVHAAIERKVLSYGWTVASEVARSRAGDCTEHAVLFAALARSLGRSARVAMGVVLVETPRGIVTYGHAWAEVHDGSRWSPVDAALPADVATAYIPLGVLDDEGPGHLLAIARIATSSWASRLEVLGN